jgi:hypothetical protein
VDPSGGRLFLWGNFSLQVQAIMWDQLPQHIRAEIYGRKAEMEQKERFVLLMEEVEDLRNSGGVLPRVARAGPYTIVGGVKLRSVIGSKYYKSTAHIASVLEA